MSNNQNQEQIFGMDTTRQKESEEKPELKKEAKRGRTKVWEHNMKSKVKLSFADLRFDKKWECHSTNGNASYVSGVILGQLFYSKLSGNATESMVDGVVSSIEATYRDGDFDGTGFIRFADYSYLNNAPLNARRAYTHAINQLNEKYA